MDKALVERGIKFNGWGKGATGCGSAGVYYLYEVSWCACLSAGCYSEYMPFVHNTHIAATEECVTFETDALVCHIHH